MQITEDRSGNPVVSVGIIASSYNKPITDGLLKGASKELKQHEVDQLDIVWVPGAFEIPAVAATMANTDRYTALIALGSVIRGETSHFNYISDQCAAGLMRVSVEFALPVGFGVLTVDTMKQAQDRSNPDNRNKGVEAAAAIIASIHTIFYIRSVA